MSRDLQEKADRIMKELQEALYPIQEEMKQIKYIENHIDLKIK